MEELLAKSDLTLFGVLQNGELELKVRAVPYYVFMSNIRSVVGRPDHFEVGLWRPQRRQTGSGQASKFLKFHPSIAGD